MRTIFLVAVFAVAAIASGCNGSDPEALPTGTANAEVTITLEDFFFNPNNLLMEAAPSRTIVLMNAGAEEHSFTIDELSIDRVLEPGETLSLKIEGAEAGDYAFSCKFHSDREMTGLLVFN